MGNSVTLAGTNLATSSGRPYEVLSSTDVTVPLSNWEAVASGAFAADGGFTKQASVSDPSRFFLIYVPRGPGAQMAMVELKERNTPCSAF